MRTLTKAAVLAVVAGVVSLAAAAPSDAHWSRYHHRYYRHHVWVHHGYGAYAYAPRHFYNAGNQNERDCMRSPASQRYVPCLNRP